MKGGEVEEVLQNRLVPLFPQTSLSVRPQETALRQAARRLTVQLSRQVLETNDEMFSIID